VAQAPTLSADAKDALARTKIEAAHCRDALLYGLLFYGVHRERAAFRTQRPALARLVWSLLQDRKDRPIRKVAGLRLHRATTYEIDVPPPAPDIRHGARCDRRMELRGAFLGCGSLALPAHGYRLEFIPPDDAAAQRLAALLRAEGLAPKLLRRKARTVVYFKDVEAIARVLASIGASTAMLHLEDVRAYKETKNRIRRLVNTEAANVDRATTAAAAQREAIALVCDAQGLASLPGPLREAAELRLAHPTDTLAELGRRCNPAVMKSTLNGRIAALVRIARRLEKGSQQDHRVSD
jgi:DNA-binding transcriptional regulator WhiA